MLIRARTITNCTYMYKEMETRKSFSGCVDRSASGRQFWQVLLRVDEVEGLQVGEDVCRRKLD